MQLKLILRFDDLLSPIRHLFEEFNKKLGRAYEPSEFLTIDEQLLEFQGRVKFQQYIASKPGKFALVLPSVSSTDTTSANAALC